MGTTVGTTAIAVLAGGVVVWLCILRAMGEFGSSQKQKTTPDSWPVPTEEERQARREKEDELKRTSMRRATEHEHRQWLEGYIDRGGRIDKLENYPFGDLTEFWVPLEDVELEGFRGARKINLIVPVGIDVKDDPAGHCGLFYFDGYRVENGLVRMYEGMHELSDIVPRESVGGEVE